MTAIEAIGISGLASSIGLLHGLGLEDRRPSLAGLLSVLARFENRPHYQIIYWGCTSNPSTVDNLFADDRVARNVIICRSSGRGQKSSAQVWAEAFAQFCKFEGDTCPLTDVTPFYSTIDFG